MKTTSAVTFGSLGVTNLSTLTGGALVGGATNKTEISNAGIVTQSGTARIGWTKKTAASITATYGTLTGAVSDLQTANDGTDVNVVEGAGANCLELRVGFTSITAFNWVQILARYQGSSSHGITIQLQITPFDGSKWHTFGYFSDQPADQNYQNHSFFVPSDADYINGGAVTLRFVHEMNGSVNHELFVDNVALYQ